MQRVAIAGISGYLGFKLAQALEHDPAVSLVLGLDRRSPPASLSKLLFVQHDARTPFDGLLLEHWIDTLVYLVPAQPPLEPVLDTLNLSAQAAGGDAGLEVGPSGITAAVHPVEQAIHRCGLHRVLLLSCAGVHEQAYELAPEFLEEHPEVKVVQISLAPVLSLDSPHPGARALVRALSRNTAAARGDSAHEESHLGKSGWIPLPGLVQDLRFCHEQDAVEAMRTLLKEEVNGWVEVKPEDGVSWWELSRALRRPPLIFPKRMVRLLSSFNARLHRGLEVPPPEGSYWERLDRSLQALDGLTPVSAPDATARVIPNVAQATDFRYQFSTRETLQAFSRSAASTLRSLSD